MNQLVQTEQPKARGLTAVMAQRFEMEPAAFVGAIKQTVIKGNANDAQVAAFLMVAHEYNLNPLTKEIYAFPSNGGIQPIVSIDGWMKLINSHPQFDGMEFDDRTDDQGNLASVTCRIYRKDRSRATEATEYMAECQRGTEPWKKWPRRMLRHKAAIQCARYAFSFAMMDEDDFDRMKDITPSDRPSVADRFAAAQPQITLEEGFDAAHVEAEVGAIVDDQPVTEISSGHAQTDVPPSSDARPTDPPSSDQAAHEGGDNNAMGSPPSPQLISCCKDFLTIAGDERLTLEQRKGALEKNKDLWKAQIDEAEHDKVKQILVSADAIIMGKTSYRSAIEFYADMFRCTPADLGAEA